MKIDFEQIKTLAESGDKTAFEAYIHKAIEKSDVALVLEANAEVKSVFDAEKDKHHNKALETWKTNNLQKLVNEEVAKRNPAKSPAEIELEKLKKQFEDSEKARNREKLMNQAIKTATEKGLPVELLDYLVADDEEGTTANLTKFEEVFVKSVQNGVESKFKQNGREVPPGSGGKSEDSYGKQIAVETGKNNVDLEEARNAYFK